MQRFWSDIMVAGDAAGTVWTSQQLSTASPTHSILLERLRSAAGLTDSVLDWLQSNLNATDCLQCGSTICCAAGAV